MTKCRSMRSLASEYVDHELSDALRREYTDHLAACAACRRHLAETREAVGLLRRAPAPEAPPELLEQTLRAIDRTIEPRLAIVAAPPSRRVRPRGAPLAFARALLFDYEFKIIAYSVGVFASLFIFMGVLEGLRPLASLSTAGNSPTIWITTDEATVMGANVNGQLATVAYTIPQVAKDGSLRAFAAGTQYAGSDDLVVLAEVDTEGRASIVEVLSGPTDPSVVSNLAVALDRPSFVPASTASGRRVASRVVLLLQRVDVVG